MGEGTGWSSIKAAPGLGSNRVLEVSEMTEIHRGWGLQGIFKIGSKQ